MKVLIVGSGLVALELVKEIERLKIDHPDAVVLTPDEAKSRGIDLDSIKDNAVDELEQTVLFNARPVQPMPFIPPVIKPWKDKSKRRYKHKLRKNR